jgi:hypothetical protein
VRAMVVVVVLPFSEFVVEDLGVVDDEAAAADEAAYRAWLDLLSDDFGQGGAPILCGSQGARRPTR